MLTIRGRKRRLCDGLGRREFLKIGGLGIGGLTLADLFRAEAAAAPGSPYKRRSIINIYLPGGPSHMDLFDIKAEAPVEFRGEFSSIETSVPGIRICEHLPRLAALMHKLVVVRSVSGLNDEHTSNQSDSGWSYNSLESIGGRPSLGSVVARLQGGSTPSAPPFVQLSGSSSPGFLGPVYQPYVPDGPGRENLSLGAEVTLDRLGDRARLLRGFDRLREELDASGTMRAIDAFNQRAVGVVTSSALADSFDLEQEDPRTRERYFSGDYDGYGNDRFLLARRLIEAGVRCVSISWGSWDTHGDNFTWLRQQLPQLDLALSSLIEDLDARGLLDETMILMSGEFGRTPRVNGGAGRDHWARVGCALLAGGGLRAGQAIGTTNRLGEYAQERPVHIQEIFATLYHQLGIDPEETKLIDPNGRPQYLVDERAPMPELV